MHGLLSLKQGLHFCKIGGEAPLDGASRKRAYCLPSSVSSGYINVSVTSPARRIRNARSHGVKIRLRPASSGRSAPQGPERPRREMKQRPRRLPLQREKCLRGLLSAKFACTPTDGAAESSVMRARYKPGRRPCSRGHPAGLLFRRAYRPELRGFRRFVRACFQCSRSGRLRHTSCQYMARWP